MSIADRVADLQSALNALKAEAFVPTPGVLPPWLPIAYAEIGQQEIRGEADNPRIVEYHSTTGLGADDDETAWCASFVGWCLEQSGHESTESAAARSYLRWGVEVAPSIGSICVLWRKSPTSRFGHVGFFLGADSMGGLWLLGGNQRNRVGIDRYDADRLLGFRGVG